MFDPCDGCGLGLECAGGEVPCVMREISREASKMHDMSLVSRCFSCEHDLGTCKGNPVFLGDLIWKGSKKLLETRYHDVVIYCNQHARRDVDKRVYKRLGGR